MAQRRRFRQQQLFQFTDWGLLNLAFFIGVELKRLTTPSLVWDDHYLILLLVHNLAFAAAAHLTGLYSRSQLNLSRLFLWRLIELVALQLFCVTAFIVVRKAYYYSREALLFSYSLWGLSLLAWRLGFYLWHQHIRSTALQQVVAVGYGPPVQQLLDHLRTHLELGCHVAGFFTQKSEVPVTELPYRLGAIDELPEYLRTHRVDHLYVFATELTDAQSEQVLAHADRYLVPLHVVPDLKVFGLSHLQIEHYAELPIFSLRPHPLSDSMNQVVKRGFDILFSGLFLLLIASWLFPILSLLVALSSPGPVFFSQLRAGRGGRPFRCYKFRSMRRSDAPFAQATPGDSRVTPLGRLLRKTNLDELPQFWNVLLGDMSVVGPRPHVLELDAQYAPYLERYKVRNVVKPGITGLAQTRGHRGATPDVRTMQHRVRMDVFYVANWSLRLDLQIILQTVLLALRGDKQAY